MEQGVRWMVSGDPRPIGVGDLVVDPDERAPRRPFDKGAGLPVQSVPLVLLIDVGRFRPDHHRQLRQTDARGDALVRVSHPRRGPDHLARERRQPRPVPGIESGQERIRIGIERFGAAGMGRILLRRHTERDERSVDIEKQQRTLRRASHAGTIAAERNGDRTVRRAGSARRQGRAPRSSTAPSRGPGDWRPTGSGSRPAWSGTSRGVPSAWPCRTVRVRSATTGSEAVSGRRGGRRCGRHGRVVQSCSQGVGWLVGIREGVAG